MGQDPLECGAPTKKVQGPLQGSLRVRRFTTGHQPPEAFCHLPTLRRARSLHPQPWREILLRPEPCSLQTTQPYHRPCPRLSFAILVSASGYPAPSQRPTLQILVFNKVPVSTFCMPLVTLPTEASGHGLDGVEKMLYVNIHLVLIFSILISNCVFFFGGGEGLVFKNSTLLECNF